MFCTIKKGPDGVVRISGCMAGTFMIANDVSCSLNFSAREKNKKHCHSSILHQRAIAIRRPFSVCFIRLSASFSLKAPIFFAPKSLSDTSRARVAGKIPLDDEVGSEIWEQKNRVDGFGAMRPPERAHHSFHYHPFRRMVQFPWIPSCHCRQYRHLMVQRFANRPFRQWRYRFASDPSMALRMDKRSRCFFVPAAISIALSTMNWSKSCSKTYKTFSYRWWWQTNEMNLPSTTHCSSSNPYRWPFLPQLLC